MSNTLNKDINKNPKDDSICVAQEILNRTQQSDWRHRLQQLIEGYGNGGTGGDHSTTGVLTNGVQSPTRLRERLIEEARERRRVIEGTKKELANWYTPRGNPDGRARTNMAQSVKGTRAWGELFIPDTPDEQIQFGRRNQVLEEAFTPLENEGVRNAGVQSSTGVQNNAGTDSNVQQKKGRVPMAGPKKKLPKFNGNDMADMIRHYKTCEMIWTANGENDQDKWARLFPATLRGVAIDWFSDTDPVKLTTWENIKKEFITEFQLLRDDNEIVVEIYSTKQGKNETIYVYARKLK